MSYNKYKLSEFRAKVKKSALKVIYNHNWVTDGRVMFRNRWVDKPITGDKQAAAYFGPKVAILPLKDKSFMQVLPQNSSSKALMFKPTGMIRPGGNSDIADYNLDLVEFRNEQHNIKLYLMRRDLAFLQFNMHDVVYSTYSPEDAAVRPVCNCMNPRMNNSTAASDDLMFFLMPVRR